MNHRSCALDKRLNWRALSICRSKQDRLVASGGRVRTGVVESL